MTISLPKSAKKFTDNIHGTTLLCPVCKSRTAVLETISKDSVNIRRRICEKGHRFSTREFIGRLEK